MASDPIAEVFSAAFSGAANPQHVQSVRDDLSDDIDELTAFACADPEAMLEELVECGLSEAEAGTLLGILKQPKDPAIEATGFDATGPLPELGKLLDNLGLGQHGQAIGQELVEDSAELLHHCELNESELRQDLEDVGMNAIECDKLCTALKAYTQAASSTASCKATSAVASAASAAPSGAPAAATAAPAASTREQLAAEMITRLIRRCADINRGDEFKLTMEDGDLLGCELWKTMVLKVAPDSSGEAAGVVKGCRILRVGGKVPADELAIVALVKQRPVDIWFRKPDLDALAGRITRFLVYAAAVKSGRVGKGSAARFLAMEGDKASKRKRAKATKRRPTLKDLKSARASMYEGEQLHEGYLDKLGSKGRKRWQKRYFSARGHYLKYFADDSKAEVKGALDLNAIQSCTIEETVMLIVELGEDVVPMQLRAASAEDAVKWAEVLNSGVQDEDGGGGGGDDGDQSSV